MWGRRKVDEEEARSKVMRNRLDSVLGLDPYGSASKPDARRNSDARQSGGTASAISVSVALADNDGHSLEEEPHIAAARTCCAEPAALHEVSAGTSVRSENCSAQETSAIGVLCCDEAECIASRGLMSDSGRYQGVEVSHGCDSKPGAELECQIPRERPAPSVSAVTGDGDGLPGELGRQQPSACSMRESVKPKTLDSGGTPCVHTSTNVFEPADSNGSELQIRSDINRIDARSATIRAALDSFTQKTEATVQGKLKPFGAADEMFSPTATSLPGPTKRLHNCPLPADALPPTDDTALIDLSQKCEELVERQSKLFEERLARIGDKTFSRAQANAHRIVSRFETYFAQAEEIKSSIDESLANLARKSREAADAQTGILEANLAKITEQIGSRIDAGLESVTGRINGYRAQVGEVNSALEVTLTGFAQRTQEAAQIQAHLFEGKMASISEQAVSQAQENLRRGITQLRETTAHSLGEQIASLAEPLRHSHSQAEVLFARLEDSRLQYNSELEKVQRSIRELSQQVIESAMEALKDKASKEVEALAVSVSQETRDRVRTEAGAATEEFIEGEYRTRLQQALGEFHERSGQELTGKLQSLYSERHKLMLDQLQRNSQQLSQELLKQIQNKCEESLDQAVSVVNDRLLMQAALLKESEERSVENIQARLQEKLEAWSKAQLAAVQQQAGNVSADVLNQMRAESEAIAQHLDERLKSDTHLLETRVVEVMQEKLQKINAEFRSMVDRAFA